jgi:hypothetical protein
VLAESLFNVGLGLKLIAGISNTRQNTQKYLVFYAEMDIARQTIFVGHFAKVNAHTMRVLTNEAQGRGAFAASRWSDQLADFFTTKKGFRNAS